jgi:hypothetical protein
MMSKSVGRNELPFYHKKPFAEQMHFHWVKRTLGEMTCLGLWTVKIALNASLNS